MKNLPKKLTLLCCLAAQILVAQLPQGLLFQNAIPLPKGEVYWQNGLGLWNHVNYALSENLSIGQGIVPIFLFDGGGEFVYTLSGKFSVSHPNRKIHAGFGLFHAGDFYDGDWTNGWLIPYGIITIGTARRQVNFFSGANFGYFDSYDLPQSFEPTNASPRPFWGLSSQLSKCGRWAFVFDGYWYEAGKDDRYLMLMPGLRFYARRFGFDLSLGGTFNRYDDGTDFFPLPWASFFVGLSQKPNCSWFQKLPKN